MSKETIIINGAKKRGGIKDYQEPVRPMRSNTITSVQKDNVIVVNPAMGG